MLITCLDNTVLPLVRVSKASLYIYKGRGKSDMKRDTTYGSSPNPVLAGLDSYPIDPGQPVMLSLSITLSWRPFVV